MTISLINTGKRFNRDWIFRHLNFQFSTGTAYAITGPNGSGKSTLLQVIAGALSASEGKIEYYTKSNQQHSGTPVDADNFYRHISFATVQAVAGIARHSGYHSFNRVRKSNP